MDNYKNMANQSANEHNQRAKGIRNQNDAYRKSRVMEGIAQNIGHMANSTMEAMASGVPVIASRVGGLPEVIEDGRSGFLFEVGNTREAAEKGIRILKDKELYDHIRKEGLKDALEKFSMDEIVDQYERLYG